MSYQCNLLEFGRCILDCPHCRDGGACQRELADISHGRYTHGPEVSFVGDRYGQPGTPRILFTRLNPTWNQEVGWFGTRESLFEYQLQHPDASAADIFDHYLRGWKTGDKVFRGMWDAGTVTGHQNKSHLSGEEKRKSPRYGIQLIMEEMTRAGVFPTISDSALRFCAVNNAVKCAGSLRNSNPSTVMYQNCKYYEKELDLLEPDILVAFGGKTDKNLRSKLRDRFSKQDDQTWVSLRTGKKCRYFCFLHPLPPGKNSWPGRGIQQFRPTPDVDRELGPVEKEQYKAGPGGSSTATLFHYTLYLVSEAKRLSQPGCDAR